MFINTIISNRGVFAVTFAAFIIVDSIALPTGAPQSACHDMTPRHGKISALSGSLAPYNLTVSNTQIVCGEAIEITLTGIANTDLFRGFLIEARPIDADDHIGDDPIGQFSLLSPTDVLAKILFCGDHIGNAVTHRNAANQLHTIGVQWKIDAPFSGSVIFRATVARDFQHFWTDVRSAKLTIGERPIVTVLDDNKDSIPSE